ncbi:MULTISPECIES: erythromycin esterase family protein [unclassified Streptomyces]|uniref:erythromycin esterase family protein n=1 Tax=unclassified Streptomyces TaxID=2593676 RepID=UPI00190D1EE9|nr:MULTISPECIES: erythromycin esterase family protein [unclassified Streptomyces]MBK3563786.1 erythromycin esterase family protein [Streptomyces sp. MBT62]MBK6009972.1 erythromycin esterase family protein [Streptomyces sp. MBT53]
MTRHRTGLILTLLIGLGAVAAGTPDATAAPPTPSASPVVTALDRSAHPLRTVEPGGDTDDLRPLDRMIGGATVVGLGEATHSSHDFFALKDRVFRHLVEKKGFRTFALEGAWSTGLRLDDYVLYGKGDPQRIMREEFQRDYLWWNNTDYLRLVEWMRAYNVRHPGDPVRFMGDDIGWAGPELYDSITAQVARIHPELSTRLAELYRGLRPTVPAGTYIQQYLDKPYAERQEMAERTGRALELLKRQAPGKDRAAYDWAVQNAAVVDQVARQYDFDFDRPAQIAAAMRYRDETMAANVVWWQRHTGTKVLLSAHDAHIGYVPSDPVNYPKMQGAFLRDTLGNGYLNVGLTFDRGSFNATGPDDAIHRWTLGPAGPGSNERTLDQVRFTDYLIDLRTVGSPARAWLDTARPTRSIGTAYPEDPGSIALARSYDVLVHLHRVTAARLRDR